VLEPFVADTLQLCDRSNQPRVEHVAAIRAVEALDVGVLVGLAGLDVTDVDLLFLAPVGKCPGGKLRAVVAAQCRRSSMNLDELLEHAYHASRRYRRANFDRQSFAIAFVDHVQNPYCTSAVE